MEAIDEVEEHNIRSQFDSSSSSDGDESFGSGDEEALRPKLDMKKAISAKLMTLFNAESSKTSDAFANFDETMERRGTDYKAGVVKMCNEESGKFAAAGWIEKRASGTFMGVANWQRRYLVLENDKLFLFEGEKPKEME